MGLQQQLDAFMAEFARAAPAGAWYMRQKSMNCTAALR
jgi:hypothetical protein